MALPTEIAAPSPSAEPSESSIAVRLEQIEKRYGDVVAVAGIDLDVRDGEFFSMLGPSGSGKTTTLRMIAGFEQPTSGRVVLHGRDVTRCPAIRARRQHGLPGLRPVPAHDGRRQRGLRADGPQGRQGDATDPGRRCAPHGPPRRLRAAQAERAVGRTAPARRPRARARQPAARAPARRAARRPRPQASRGDADRAQADPATGRDHVHLRHPRPGRGAHDERPPGGLQQRADRAARSAGRGLRATHDVLCGRASSGPPTS